MHWCIILFYSGLQRDNVSFIFLSLINVCNHDVLSTVILLNAEITSQIWMELDLRTFCSFLLLKNWIMCYIHGHVDKRLGIRLNMKKTFKQFQYAPDITVTPMLKTAYVNYDCFQCWCINIFFCRTVINYPNFTSFSTFPVVRSPSFNP